VTRTRSFWGWGFTEAALSEGEVSDLGSLVSALVDGRVTDPARPPVIAEVRLPAGRIVAPDAIADWISADPAERAGHTYGKSFRDVVRGLASDFGAAPDLVAFPPDEGGVTAVLDWCADAGHVVIPYGGGSSVVGGTESPPREATNGVVSLDLRHLDGVIELDDVSRSVRVRAGTFGPALEGALRPAGFTLRHYPQSFEQSTVGGWLATRSGGHFATLQTHIDDMVESIRAITPSGVWESRRLPGSGAGPSPDRLLLGSEGILGVITESWLKVLPRPTFKASGVGRFPSFSSGAQAARALAQSGLWPSNCRLLDATEAMITGAGDGSSNLLLVAFESADHPVDAAMARAAELVSDHGGTIAIRPSRHVDQGSEVTDESDSWRSTFLRAPYIRDALVRLGLINETFETAITWDHFDTFVDGVLEATRDALRSVDAWPAVVTCRVTHCYPNGAAPYVTVIAPGRPGARLDQWATVKSAAMDAIDRLGGTVTHHHAVGRDHRPGYDRQRPELFAAALRAAKTELDPSWVLNPGVLIDPVR